MLVQSEWLPDVHFLTAFGIVLSVSSSLVSSAGGVTLQQSQKYRRRSYLHLDTCGVYVMPTFYKSPTLDLKVFLHSSRLQALLDIQQPLCNMRLF